MRIIKLLLTIFICAMLCACSSSEETMDVLEIDKTQNSLQFILSEKNYEELCKVLGGKPSVSSLHNSISVDFIKATDTGYSTVFQTERGLVLVVFDSQQMYAYAKNIRLSQSVLEKEMDGIEKGAPLEKIQSLDPNGDYSFLYVSQSGAPAISHHYLENGMHYTIYYDDEFCVLSVKKEML
ncbi:MAG: hypothetical protein ACI3W5_08815 [Faecousia sp.]